MKTVTLKQTGYTVRGNVTINLWGGGRGSIEMDQGYIPLEKLSKESLLRCVNDGRFGCESIDSAEIFISDRFENGYDTFNRSIKVKGLSFRQEFFCRGI